METFLLVHFFFQFRIIFLKMLQFVDKWFGKPKSPWTSVQIALVFEIAKHILYISALGGKKLSSKWSWIEKHYSSSLVWHINDIPPKRVVALRSLFIGPPVLVTKFSYFKAHILNNKSHNSVQLPPSFSFDMLISYSTILIPCQYQTSVCFVSEQSTSYCKGSPVLASSVLANRDPLLKYIAFYNL